MATVYYARWILLEDGSLLERGALAVDGNRITAIGSRGGVNRKRGDRMVNLGDTLLLPGLINMHTHLEEGVFRGMGTGIDEPFVSRLAKKSMRLRQAPAAAVRSSVRLGARELLTNGVTTVFDTSRLGFSSAVLADEPLRAWVHQEIHPLYDESDLDGIRAAQERLAESAGNVGAAVGPYALFSLQPAAHRRTIHLARELACVWACHVAESAEEVQAFSEQAGDLYFHICRRGEWPYGTNLPGPMYYAITNSLIPNNAVCFHCNYATGHDLALLAAKQVSVVIGMSYTEELGHKPFPVDIALKRGVRVCVGTESVAETPSLSLFDELFRLRQYYRHLPAVELLKWVTRNPAFALGMGRELGALAPGRLADMVGVRVPHAPRQDVLEELLVEEPTVTLVIVDGEEIIANS
ncbi:MAG: amidohydrolase family protein [Chitinivibrionales bacterium]|nr:amidohydrolase family protein [Chitinivibrionales bacterium]